jgi:5-methylcytosine-specific restriction endonuclease McrA
VIECLPKIREQIQAATNLSRNRVARIKSEERSEARRRRNIKPIASQTFVHGMVPYQRRNKLLSEMRFGSYAEYLESDLWKEIRNRVLIRDGLRCRVCASEATQVHHKSYDRCVLAGESIDQLISICETCHEAIEFG